jgi:transcriptional regulator with XRE-family HTH domain
VKTSFGTAVRAIREQCGLSQATLAKAVGMTAQNLSLIEQDVRGVERDPEVVERLETALGVKSGELAKFLPATHLARKIGSFLPFIGGVSAGAFEPLLEPEPGELINVRDRYPDGSKVAVVSGHSCTRFGLFHGDLVVLRDATEPEEGRFVVAETGEGLTLKGYAGGQLYRWYPDTDAPEVVPYTEDTVIRGVVIQRTGDVRFALPKGAAKPKKRKT